MTKRERQLRHLYAHLCNDGDASVKSYFTYDGRKLEWTATLYGGGEFITCERFGRYSVRNTLRSFRWLLWNMLCVRGEIEWVAK